MITRPASVGLIALLALIAVCGVGGLVTGSSPLQIKAAWLSVAFIFFAGLNFCQFGPLAITMVIGLWVWSGLVPEVAPPAVASWAALIAGCLMMARLENASRRNTKIP